MSRILSRLRRRRSTVGRVWLARREQHRAEFGRSRVGV
ncbi:hypothetical protein BJ979_002455 [Schumannella luteola]|uniref:Uncharacterized protein n=1 Tax=Schumannella luteola TaxID=472059 RepID=A0A852YQ22_9MICO|nr:hypothetical protein [Schumannella luteola]